MLFFYLFIVLLISFLIGFFVYTQNYVLQKTEYTVEFSDLPDAFSNMKILHLTDIHRKSFGKDQKKLIDMIRQANPDIIVVSGDIIYCYNHWYNFRYDYNKDLSKIMKIFDALVNEFPIYYAPGNHECKSNFYPTIKEALLKCGITVLDSGIVNLTKNGQEISLLGLKDPTFWGGSNIVVDEYLELTKKELLDLKSRSNNRFTVLISHRPEIFDIYKDAEIDIVFTGHAHGGQWRFPIIGPVYAPQQGYFPKYTNGVHTFDKTNVIINRGMGNSTMPIRLFNRPEVVVVTLKRKY